MTDIILLDNKITIPNKPPLGLKPDPNLSLTQGLVGCWMFNEGGGDKVVDACGNFEDGTFETGDSDPPVWSQEQFGKSIYFDGDGFARRGYINIPHSNIMDTLTSISIEVVFNSNDDLNFYPRILKKTDSFRLALSDQPSPYGGLGTVWISSSSYTATLGQYINAGEYTHLVMTYNQEEIQVYCNGGRYYATQTSPSGPIDINTNPIIVGLESPTGGDTFGGHMLYLRIWNRALNLGEVRGLYANPYGMFERPLAIQIEAAAAGLSISVSETVGAIESLSPIESGGKLSISDLVGIIENVISEIESLDINITADDLIGVVENVSSKMSSLDLSSDDIIAISENISSRMSNMSLSLYDVAAIIETININLGDFAVSTEDFISIIESVSTVISDSNFTLADVIGTIENISVQVSDLSFTQVSELIAISENVITMASELSLSIFESGTVQENITTAMSDVIGDRYDSVVIEEFVNTVISDPDLVLISSYEMIGIIENISMIASSLERITFDKTVASEYISAVMSNFLPNITENITIVESLASRTSSLLSTPIDQAAISEFLSFSMSDFGTSVFSSTAVQEYINILLVLFLPNQSAMSFIEDEITKSFVESEIITSFVHSQIIRSFVREDADG